MKGPSQMGAQSHFSSNLAEKAHFTGSIEYPSFNQSNGRNGYLFE